MSKPCSFPGCDRFSRASGLCNGHRIQVSRGQPLRALRVQGASLPDRFWPNVDKNGTIARVELGPCWTWTGPSSKHGYGRINANRRWTWAHRVSWELATGAAPGALDVCHRCDNPPCVRPSHLFLGTARDNAADMVAKGRNKHGEKAPNARLTAEMVIDIRSRPTSEQECKRLAALYGLGVSTVRNAAKGRSWRHLGMP